MAKCLRCGAGNEWIQGKVPNEPKESAPAVVSLVKLRQAVANYMDSEGCSCCESSEHDEHSATLAKLLKVPKYKDGSGYHFGRYKANQR